MHSSSRKRRKRLFDGVGSLDRGDGKVEINEASKEFVGFFFGLEIVVEIGGEAKIGRNFIDGFTSVFFDSVFALDDKAKRWALDATGRDGARNFFAYNARKIETNQHIERLAGLLAGDHIHINSTRRRNGVFEGGLGNLVESDTRSVVW